MKPNTWPPIYRGGQYGYLRWIDIFLFDFVPRYYYNTVTS